MLDGMLVVSTVVSGAFPVDGAVVSPTKEVLITSGVIVSVVGVAPVNDCVVVSKLGGVELEMT